MKKRILYLFLLAWIAIGGCDKPESTPAYLRIEPFIVNEKGGASWQKFTDGWLYVNNEFLGAYTLPATVPILAEGESDIILFPGVKENGIEFTPNLYLFMERYETTVSLTPPAVTTIKPETEYASNIKIPWGERGDFDGSSELQFENRDSDAATSFDLTTEEAFFGKSLRMQIDTAHPVIEIASEKVSLPSNSGQEVWLELHHKNDMPFTLVLLSSNPASTEIAQDIYFFNNSDGWNKIYINLTEFLTTVLQEDHRLFFRVSLPKDEQNKYSQLTGKVMLDNIRLLHF